MQLLACIVLNELADVDRVDQLHQLGIVGDSGSVGIAQIQIATALHDRLVDVPDWSFGRSSGAVTSRSVAIRWRLAADRLRLPQFSIEAAAREVELLLGRMGSYVDRPWQQRWSFTGTGPEGDAIYERIAERRRAVRESNLASMVAGA